MHMSRPRPVFPGDVIHIQRRTRDGRFFLVPRARTVQLVQYAYAVAAARTGVRIHALCIMSNHIHAVATDTDGRHPEFTAYAHRLIALGIKSMFGVDGTIWSEGGASVQRLVGETAVVEALAYVAVNPVAAGCVRHEREYSALFLYDESAARRTRVARPACFAEDSVLPCEAELVLTPLTTSIHVTDPVEAARRLRCATRRRREEAVRELTSAGRRFIGMRGVLAVDVWTRPRRPVRRGDLSPTFKGALREAIRFAAATLRAFRRAYAEAMEAFRAGRRNVKFPPGTYLMRKRYGCAVEVAIAA
jgi:putative transposase